MIPVTMVTRAEVIKRIADMPNNRRWATSDDSPDEYVPIFAKGLYYIAPMVEGRPAGIVRFDAVDDGILDTHIIWDPEFYGCAAEGLYSATISMQTFTDCRAIIAAVPVDNRAAIRTAIAAGFRKIGVLEKSFKRGGRMIDQEFMRFRGVMK